MISFFFSSLKSCRKPTAQQVHRPDQTRCPSKGRRMDAESRPVVVAQRIAAWRVRRPLQPHTRIINLDQDCSTPMTSPPVIGEYYFSVMTSSSPDVHSRLQNSWTSSPAHSNSIRPQKRTIHEQ